jgi:membrane-bound serine protease (ClpP class)
MIAVFLLLPAPAPQAQENAPDKAWIIPIQGDIEPAMAAFVRREARKALGQGAEVIIFEIDTFGGRVDSALRITSFITSVKNARTVAWVHNSETSLGVSWSAGALIAFSCADIYMANGTSIGAAAPVTISPDGSAEPTGEKTVSAVRSQMAALAERNGHPKSIALAMVDFDVELWEVLAEGVTKALTKEEAEALEKGGGAGITRVREISPKGKLLSLTAGEACRYGLARGLADDGGALLAGLGIPGGFIESAPSAADGFIALLTSGAVQSLLILLGLVLLFLELNTPGFGVPGTLSVICFLAVFGSSALLGQTGSLEIMLFIAGLGLLAVELFVLPGFGVIGVSGIILIGFSLMLSMQDFILPRFEWEWGLLIRNAAVVGAGIILSAAGIAVIALLGPALRIFDPLTLKTRLTGTACGGAEDDRAGALAGMTGAAVSALRPSGNAEIGGRIYSVESEGVFIEKGSLITVTQVRGNRIIVRPPAPPSGVDRGREGA